MTEVRDNRDAQRFELEQDGGVATLAYERRPESIVFVHTEVPLALRGHGIGEALVKGALALARAQGLSVVAVCPFVRAYLKRHPRENP